jgi:hypothetical protein
MTDRIRLADLEGIIRLLNIRTNSPAEPYTRTEDGKYRANVGNFHLSRAYGGFSLHRMYSDGGAVTDAFRSGHLPARDLYNRISALLKGFEIAADA